MTDKQFAKLVREIMPLWVELINAQGSLSPEALKILPLMRSVMDHPDEGNLSQLEEALERMLE